MRISTNHTDQCLRALRALQIDPKDYTFNGCLELRNMGPEVKLGAHAAGEDPMMVLVPTGIRALAPSNVALLVQEKASVLGTRIVVRTVPYQAEEGGEIHVTLLNLGKHDALIPAGAKLPAQLLALPVYNETSDLNYREYLETTATKAQGR